MKEYDEYEDLINEISKYAIINKIKLEKEYIFKIYQQADNNIKDSIDKAMKLRTKLGYTNEEVASFHIYLNSGCQIYSTYKNKDVAFCVSLDICHRVKRLLLIKNCEKYNHNDLIFLKYPDLKKLISNRQDLINISKMKVCGNTKILNYENMRIKMNDCINPNLINYLKNKYPNKELLVRIDKDDNGEYNNESIEEIVLRSERSNWYKKMLIYNCSKKMGEYSYPETIINLGYNKKNADRNITKLSENGYEEERNYILQTFFARDNSGLLSGSIEEMKPLESDNTLVSKYIHLTSNSKIGTEWNEGVLAHIDGAINVYFDNNARKRLSKKLNEKVRSDYRTHLFRINNIPITELIPIAKLFFNGLALVEEWESDSFN